MLRCNGDCCWPIYVTVVQVKGRDARQTEASRSIQRTSQMAAVSLLHVDNVFRLQIPNLWAHQLQYSPLATSTEGHLIKRMRIPSTNVQPTANPTLWSADRHQSARIRDLDYDHIINAATTYNWRENYRTYKTKPRRGHSNQARPRPMQQCSRC